MHTERYGICCFVFYKKKEKVYKKDTKKLTFQMQR